MKMLVLTLLVFFVRYVVGYDLTEVREIADMMSARKVASENGKMMFPSLDNYEVAAKSASEVTYPWIARVVHSNSAGFPHLCTAVCIDTAIFITAMRCVYGLKVAYTRIMYRKQHLNARAFVMPANLTQDAFDDIGFIVVNPADYTGVWAIIELFRTPNRTDNLFYWFEPVQIPYELLSFKVVGYAMKKVYHKLRSATRLHFLTDLNVQVGINICAKLIAKDAIRGLRVPCYHPCTLHEQSKNNPKCNSYHGVEGGAVFDTTSNKLLGVATWGLPTTGDKDYPVGFSVPNSNNFFKDYVCARRIRSDKVLPIYTGYYQKLCDKNR